MFGESVIVSMARTAVGSFGRSLKSKSAVELGAITIKEALCRADISGDTVDEVVYGCVGQYGLNVFISRLASLQAGVRKEASAQTVNRMCASGLQSIITASMLVENGDAQVTIAGGAESMSNYPYTLQDARWGMRMGMSGTALLDSLQTALCEPLSGEKVHIAVTAENIATKYGLSREMLDAYALESQVRAKAAIEAGKFKDEIVPVEIKSKKEIFCFETDEHPRETSMEKLGKLKPLFKADGVVTAGNASGVNDAGAALVIMSRQKAQTLGVKPIARIVDFATAGVDPIYMGMGPVASTRKLLRKTGMQMGDFGLIELNEAFAAQALACIRELEIDPAICNVNGSGISLGHPVGATGAIITIKLISEMKRREVRYGLATLCIGGGQGMSAIIENL